MVGKIAHLRRSTLSYINEPLAEIKSVPLQFFCGFEPWESDVRTVDEFGHGAPKLADVASELEIA